MELNTRERFVRVLTGQEVDRVPFIKIFGGTNAVVPDWKKKYPNIELYIDELLRFEGKYRGWQIAPVNYSLCGVPEAVVIKDTGNETVIRNGDGSLVVNRKGDFHQYTLEYPVKGWNEWNIIKERYLNPDDPRRIPADWSNYAEIYNRRDFPLQLTCGGVFGFARNMMGDEALMYAFYDDPELVKDIIGTYINMCLRLWEHLTAKVQFDLIECWEDMAFKGGSLISPEIFKDFLAPHYRRIREFADSHNIPIVLVDSDGYIEELAGWMVEAGVNAMYPFEVQSGNNVERVLNKYKTLGGIGGLNKNCMAIGRDAIDSEMEAARKLIAKGRFIPGPDHFALSDVSFENYSYFMKRLREVILTTRPGS